MSINPLDGLMAAIKKMIPDEFIDGQNVAEIAELFVDLEAAYSPVLDVAMHGDPATSHSEIPKPVTVTKDGNRFCLTYVGDYQWVRPDALKIMRARYLLLRGYYAKRLDEDSFGYPAKQKVLAYFFPDGYLNLEKLTGK